MAGGSVLEPVFAFLWFLPKTEHFVVDSWYSVELLPYLTFGDVLHYLNLFCLKKFNPRVSLHFITGGVDGVFETASAQPQTTARASSSTKFAAYTCIAPWPQMPQGALPFFGLFPAAIRNDIGEHNSIVDMLPSVACLACLSSVLVHSVRSNRRVVSSCGVWYLLSPAVVVGSHIVMLQV